MPEREGVSEFIEVIGLQATAYTITQPTGNCSVEYFTDLSYNLPEEPIDDVFTLKSGEQSLLDPLLVNLLLIFFLMQLMAFVMIFNW